MMDRLTFGKLDRKFPKSNTIAMSQHYAENVLRNPNTSYADKMVMIDYIRTHSDIFTPLNDDTDDMEWNEIAKKLNGNNPKRDFIASVCRCDAS